MLVSIADLKNELKNIAIKPLSGIDWIIKNIEPSKIPDDYFYNVWDSLKESISAIFSNKRPGTSLELLYRVLLILE